MSCFSFVVVWIEQNPSKGNAIVADDEKMLNLQQECGMICSQATSHFMPQFASAIELLAPGETALVIFTVGHHLTDNHDGTGSTGWWVINPHRKVNRIIIYRRASDDLADNDLFIGRHDGVEGPREDGRYLVRLLDFKLAGHTASNWRKFADTYSKSLRYVSRPMA